MKFREGIVKCFSLDFFDLGGLEGAIFKFLLGEVYHIPWA